VLTRRKLIQSSAAAAAAAALVPRSLATAQAEAAQGKGIGKNIVMFITDQERAIQHFPKGWAKDNLPGLTRLQQNGITFDNAFCCACMCSPSRASLLTGYFPAQHGVKYTLEEDMPSPEYPQVELPEDLKNMASVMSASGYDVVYKGKWHLSKPAGSQAEPSDVAKYGFFRWNPPDAGANQDISEAGGGSVDNDGRYMTSIGNPADGTEGVLQYLKTRTPASKPFFLIVSLVNPHDVLLYPRNYVSGGYDSTWLDGDIELPPTVNENLSSKPTAQAEFVKIMALTGVLPTPTRKRNYLNFYGNLMKDVDEYLVNVLDTLDDEGLTNDTLVIRTSDHGEMGLTHGGMRQKNFNFYEETLRVPLVFSNPQLYPEATSSDIMVSHVDMLPTLAGLVGAPRSARADWEGRDYSKQVLGSSTKPVQDYVVFTYDDYQAGQASGPYVKPPQHIVSIRETRWKLAEYFDANGKTASQWEMYDLKHDPNERRNLAAPGAHRTKEQERQFVRLQRKLALVQATRLQPLPGAFDVTSVTVSGAKVRTKVHVPGRGALTQVVTRMEGDRKVVAGRASGRTTKAGSTTLTATLSAETERLRESHAVPLQVRTTFRDPVDGPSTVTESVMAGRLHPSFTG